MKFTVITLTDIFGIFFTPFPAIYSSLNHSGEIEDKYFQQTGAAKVYIILMAMAGVKRELFISAISRPVAIAWACKELLSETGTRWYTKHRTIERRRTRERNKTRQTHTEREGGRGDGVKEIDEEDAGKEKWKGMFTEM